MLDNLPKDVVQRNLELHKQFVQELDPSLEVTPGPFHDTVLYYSALFTTLNQQQVATILAPLRLGRLLKNPDAVDPALIDAIAANWLTDRLPGKSATGLINITLARPVSTAVPRGTLFEYNGMDFRVPETFTLRTSGGSAVLADDRVLRQVGNKWVATIPVVATVIGSAGNLRKGTTLRAKDNNTAIRYAVAAADFTDGQDRESNTLLLRRLVRGAAGKVVCNRPNIDALIARYFPTHVSSIIGHGDVEMLRDKQGAFPISVGGCVDIYVYPGSHLTTYTHVLPGKRSDVADEWLITVPRSAAAGVYSVVAVQATDGTSVSVLESIRDFDITDTPFKTCDALNAAYSVLQTLHIRIRYTGNISTFNVTLRGFSGLSTLQAALSKRDVTNPAANILVKAPVPCYVRTLLEIQSSLYGLHVSAKQIRDAVVSAVNAAAFTGQLTAASITTAVTQLLSESGAILRRIQLSGAIHCPDDSCIDLSNDSILTVPTTPQKLLTPRTVVFIQELEAIQIRLIPVDGTKAQLL